MEGSGPVHKQQENSTIVGRCPEYCMIYKIKSCQTEKNSFIDTPGCANFSDINGEKMTQERTLK